jgi:hypothetical protein
VNNWKKNKREGKARRKAEEAAKKKFWSSIFLIYGWVIDYILNTLSSYIYLEFANTYNI